MVMRGWEGEEIWWDEKEERRWRDQKGRRAMVG